MAQISRIACCRFFHQFGTDPQALISNPVGAIEDKMDGALAVQHCPDALMADQSGSGECMLVDLIHAPADW